MTATLKTDRSVALTVIGILCVLAACAQLYVRATLTFPSDLSAIYMAGYLFDLGRSDLIYNAPDGFFGGSPPLWQPYIDSLGLTEKFVTPYVYPPLWAAVAAPVAHITTPQAFFGAAALVQIPMLAVSPLLAWRITGPRAPDLGLWLVISGALLFTSQIAAFAVDLLQPQILVTFLTLLAFERYRTGRALTAGGLLAVAAMLKLAPGALALIFLLDRNWRALASFVLVCAVIGLASLGLVGIDLHREFVASVGEVGSLVFLSASNFSVTPLLAVVATVTGMAPELDLAAKNLSFSGEATAVVGTLSKILFLAFLGWSIWRSGQLAEGDRLILRLLVFSLLLNLFGPLGWIHYYLLPMFLLPALPALIRPPWGYALLLLVAVVTSHWVFWALYWSRPGDVAVVGSETGTLFLLVLALNLFARTDRTR